MTQDTANEARPDVVRVQEQLLEMLRTVGQEAPPPRREAPVAPAEPAPVAAPAVAAPKPKKYVAGSKPAPGEACPKCGSESPWGNSSWCPDCGYFPKAGFDGTGIVEEPDDTPVKLVDVLPPWVGPLAIGAVGVFIGSITSRFIFGDALQRALVSLTQLLVCFGMVLAAHFRASFLCVKDGKSMMAVVNLGETWASMLAKVPKTNVLILLMGWGLAGAGSSLLIGMDVNLIAEEVKKEVADRPKVRLKDIIGAMTGITRKAFKGKNVAGAFGALVNNMGGGGGPAGGSGFDGGFSGSDGIEGAIGDLANTAGIVSGIAGAGGGGDAGPIGDPNSSAGLENAIGGFGGVANGITGQNTGGGGGGDLMSSGGAGGKDPFSALSGQGTGGLAALAAGANPAGTESTTAGSGTATTQVASALGKGGEKGDGSILPSAIDKIPEIPGLEKVPDLLPGQMEVRTAKSGDNKSEKDEKPKSAETAEFWVYGYTANPAGEVRSLLLAISEKGKLRYVMKLGLEGVSDESLKKMTEELKPFRARSTTISSPYNGKWVKPVVKCRIGHDGLNDDGRPTNPKYDQLILP